MTTKKYFSNPILNTFSPEEIKEYQEERLRSQIKYCYSASSFYRRKFEEVGAQPEDIRTLENMRALPIFMNEDQERKNAIESIETEGHPFGTHLCAPVDEIYLIGTTSGTTGTPTFTYTFSKEDIELIAEGLGHRFAYNGVKKGDRILVFFALGIYATTMSLWGIRNIGALPVDIDSRAGSELMLSFAELTKPSYMATTVSLAEYLISKAPDVLGKEVLDLKLKGLMLTGEIGVNIPEVKKRLEEAYGCPVYDYWAPAGHAIAITLRNPSKMILILSSAVNFRRVLARTSLMSFAALPGVAVTPSLSNTWVVISMASFLSDSLHYSRLFHPDQPQKCKLNFIPVCPLLAEDQHLILLPY